MIPSKKEWTDALIAPPKIKIREASDLEVTRDAHKSPYVGIIQIR